MTSNKSLWADVDILSKLEGPLTNTKSTWYTCPGIKTSLSFELLPLLLIIFAFSRIDFLKWEYLECLDAFTIIFLCLIVSFIVLLEQCPKVVGTITLDTSFLVITPVLMMLFLSLPKNGSIDDVVSGVTDGSVSLTGSIKVTLLDSRFVLLLIA